MIDQEEEYGQAHQAAVHRHVSGQQRYRRFDPDQGREGEGKSKDEQRQGEPCNRVPEHNANDAWRERRAGELYGDQQRGTHENEGREQRRRQGSQHGPRGIHV